jgi:hypothetical protein
LSPVTSPFSSSMWKMPSSMALSSVASPRALLALLTLTWYVA